MFLVFPHVEDIRLSARCKHGKGTTFNPCLLFSESDSKLYTNFEFYEEKYQTLGIKKIKKMIYKAKQNMMIKKNSKRSLCI